MSVPLPSEIKIKIMRDPIKRDTPSPDARRRNYRRRSASRERAAPKMSRASSVDDRDRERGGGRHSVDRGDRSSKHKDKRSSYDREGSSRGHQSRIDPEPGFSSYYRERFGSHSPEEYQNLRLSHFFNDIPAEEIRDILMREFERFGDHEVKVVRHPTENQRLAYVNFARKEVARKARKTCCGKLRSLIGPKLKMDPAGVIRDQDGKFVEKGEKTDRGGRGASQGGRGGGGYYDRGGMPPEPKMAIGRNSFAPPEREYYPSNRRGNQEYSSNYRGNNFRADYAARGRGRGGGGPPGEPYYNSMRGRGAGPQFRPQNQDPYQRSTQPMNDHRAMSLKEYVDKESRDPACCRTLFVGNLPAGITEDELKKFFDRYGAPVKIDIKTPDQAQFAYAFVSFENLDYAVEARYHETDRNFENGKLKIGYGKPRKTNIIWVGGLGTWSTEDALMREFDRYGMIDKIEYTQGADSALITFASSDAAADANRAMRGFPLGGRDKPIRVDFAPPEGGDAAYDEAQAKLLGNKRRRSGSGSSHSSDSSGGSFKKRPAKRKNTSHASHSSDDDDSGSMSSSRKGKGRGPRTPSPPPSPLGAVALVPPPEPPLCTLVASTIAELESVRSPCWTGALVLKKSAYAVRLYKLSGDDDLIDVKMRNPDNGESVKLNVTQRLPFTASNLLDRFTSGNKSQLAFMVAVANSNVPAADLQLAEASARPFKAFVHYLNEKQAAGVVGLSDGAILYVFPHCTMSSTLLKSIAPSITVLTNNPENALLMILNRTPAKDL